MYSIDKGTETYKQNSEYSNGKTGNTERHTTCKSKPIGSKCVYLGVVPISNFEMGTQPQGNDSMFSFCLGLFFNHVEIILQ